MADAERRREALRRGELGEELAARHLESLGQTILARNFRRRVGEVDIVARDGDCLVFVEVKLRREAGAFGPASLAVNAAKRRRLVRAAEHYLARFRDPPPCRFDVIEVLGDPRRSPVLRHIPDAFRLGQGARCPG